MMKMRFVPTVFGVSFIAASFAASLAVVALAPRLAAAADLTGTLQKIKESKTITLGLQESSIPFSYLDDKQVVVGYSVDLCMGIVEALKQKLDLADLTVRRVPVTSSTRIPLIVNGTIDLQCGSTTNNAERRKQVDFSYPFYFAAVRIMAPKASGIKTYQDLKGKSVVTTAGTTAIHVLKAYSDKNGLDFQLPTAKDHGEGFLTMKMGRVDAVANDDVLLYGLRAVEKAPDDFIALPGGLSSEPYGLIVRRDDAPFKAAVNAALAAMYKDGRAASLYAKWFEKPIPPNGVTMGLPPSDPLKAAFADPQEIKD